MKMERSVSVIIPTYNRAHLIGEAIQSVLAQHIENCKVEIIVVDDGSTDNTYTVVQEFGDNVRYIYQKHSGAGVARNHGIEEARGDWIAFLDSDDRWLPYKLSLQFRVLDAFPNYKAIHSDFYIFDERGNIIEKGLKYWIQSIRGPTKVDWSKVYSNRYKSADYHIYHGNISFDIYTGNIFEAELRANYANCCTLLVLKECLSPDIRFAENYPTWEDYWFFCRFTEKYDFIFMDVATLENRGHSGPRLTKVDLTEKLKYHIDICKRIYFPSKSTNRPPDEEIEKHYKMMHINLFKEYLKKGMRLEAKKILFYIKSFSTPGGDRTFWLYWIASLFPFNVIKYLVVFKRFLYN